jgi:hypothetical protein
MRKIGGTVNDCRNCSGPRMILWACGLILLSTAIAAHAQLPTGTILGVAKDTSGGVVPGVTITIRNEETGFTRTITTEDDGSYRASALPIGHYSVRAEKSGFKTATQGKLTLDVAQELVVNPALEVGTSSQEVLVTAEVPQVNTTSGTLGGLVNEDKISDLPLNGRNYIDLTLLQSGIAHAAEAGSVSSTTTGVWFSSNGAPPRSNNILLDGARLTNQQGTTSATPGGTTLGVDGIREYRVITDMFSAEYGMTMGSQVVMVSKGGTNQWHGDVFEYLRNSDLDARNFFDYGYLANSGTGPRLPPFRRNNFGGSFGGPIKKNKTFFYVVYEGLRQAIGQTINNKTFAPQCHNLIPNGSGNYEFDSDADAKACSPSLVGPGGSGTITTVQSVMVPLLALYPNPNLAGNRFTFPASNYNSENYGQGRFDHDFSTADSFFGRYTLDRFDALNTGQYPQFKSNIFARNEFITASENHIFSPVLLNIFRASFSRTTSSSLTETVVGPSLTGTQYSFRTGVPMGDIVMSGFKQFGPAGGPTSTSLQNVYTISDDLFYAKGPNAFKFGLLFNRFQEAIPNLGGSYNGEIAFGSIPAFLQGQATNIQETVPGNIAARFFNFNTWGLYAQDDVRATSRLTLNLGLRYEFNTQPQELNGFQWSLLSVTDNTTTQGPVIRNSSLKNFSPRIGFAYALNAKGTMAVRGGFGLYYDVGNIGTALSQQGFALPPLNNGYSLGGVTLTSLPLTFAGSTGSLQGSLIHSLDYHSGQPHMLQYNLTVEQQLPAQMALSVGYVGSRGIDLFSVVEENPNVPLSVTNGIEYWGPDPTVLHPINPNWGSVTMVATGRDSWYHSLQANLSMRAYHGLEFQAAYTWSRSFDTTQAQQYVFDCFAASGSTSPVDPEFPRTDKGPSCFDIPQDFRFNMLYRIPNLKSNSFAASMLHGWWLGSIVSLQSGYPFSANTANLLSNSGVFAADQGDRPNLVTTANLAAAKVADPLAVPYDPNTVIVGTLNEWYNPHMFTLVGVNQTPYSGTQVCAPAALPTCSFGYLGDSSRDMMRGPHLRTWDASVNKDTKLPFLGEGGALQFRAEMFNILNHPVFALPDNLVFNANVTQEGPLTTANGGTAGVVSATAIAPRQIQLALKLIF